MNLRTSAERVRRAEARLSADRDTLYGLIRQAHEDGMTLRAIAAETGLSFGRIHQIVNQD